MGLGWLLHGVIPLSIDCRRPAVLRTVRPTRLVAQAGCSVPANQSARPGNGQMPVLILIAAVRSAQAGVGALNNRLHKALESGRSNFVTEKLLNHNTDKKEGQPFTTPIRSNDDRHTDINHRRCRQMAVCRSPSSAPVHFFQVTNAFFEVGVGGKQREGGIVDVEKSGFRASEGRLTSSMACGSSISRCPMSSSRGLMSPAVLPFRPLI